MSAVEPTDIQLATADELSDLTADLVELARHEPLLRRLFAFDAGIWVTLQALIADDDDLLAELRALEAAAEGELRVMWSPFPDGVNGSGLASLPSI